MQCGAIRMAAELVKKGGDKKAEPEGSCGTREKAKGSLCASTLSLIKAGVGPTLRFSSTSLFIWGLLGIHPSGPICELHPCCHEVGPARE